MTETGTQGAPSPPRLLEFDLSTPDGNLRGMLAIPPGPMRLAELARSTLPLVDRLVELATRREQRAGRVISCGPGCGACCRQLAPVSPPEAYMLADLLMHLPAERQARYLERFEAAASRLEAEGLSEALLRTPESDEAARALAARYFLLGIPCPFLEEESCSVHGGRPSVCREYLVTSPAADCADPAANPIRRVGVSVRLSEALARLHAELFGGEPQLVPLSLAISFALEHIPEGRHAWDGVALTRRLLALMSGAQP